MSNGTVLAISEFCCFTAAALCALATVLSPFMCLLGRLVDGTIGFYVFALLTCIFAFRAVQIRWWRLVGGRPTKRRSRP